MTYDDSDDSDGSHSTINSENCLDLNSAVKEVLALLTGLDLEYRPELDRFRAVTRQINRGMRSIALEHEWSYYVSVKSLGPAVVHERHIVLSDNRRPRIINDDAIRLVDTAGRPRVWAYFLPRDALHKYASRRGLWASVTRNLVQFSRPFTSYEHGLDIQLPIMREPRMFRLPYDPETSVPDSVRSQRVDFEYPDLVVLRAAYFYAQTDPVMQPRVQTIEAQYKDLMYQIIERDDRMTDSPFQNEFFVPVQNGIYPESSHRPYPLSDERR